MDGAFSAQAGNDASVRAVLEAMSCGLPVVAVSEGALGEVVTREVGFGVVSRVPEKIVSGLSAFLNRDQAMGINARKKMEIERPISLEAQRTISYYENRMKLKS